MRAADLDDLLPGFRTRRRARREVRATAGRSLAVTPVAAAMYIAEGNESFDDCDMLTSIVRVHRRFGAERRAGELAGAIGDDLIDVHVELRSTPGHPDMERKHVRVPPGEDLVADA